MPALIKIIFEFYRSWRRYIPWIQAMVCMATAAAAADWPMWRGNPSRTGVSPDALPQELHLQWSRRYPPLEPPWPHPGGLDFGRAYTPVVAGGRVFIASSHDHSVRALDLESGAELWRFYADGPIYFAPAADDGRLYVGADDGYVYCLDQAQGTIVWKHRPGPPRQVALGNQRPADLWPVRGAPVVDGGVVYAAAGIWPFMGVFVTALDAGTGSVLWQNDDDQSRPVLAEDRIEGGLSPQGYLALAGDALLVPNGRAVPAAFDRITGRQRYFRTAQSWKQHEGGFMISADPDGRHWFNSGIMYDGQTGQRLSLFGHRFEAGSDQIPEDNRIYVRVGNRLRAFDLDKGWDDIHDRLGRAIRVRRQPAEIWACELEKPMTLHLKAGSRLFLSATGTVAALTVPPADGSPPGFDWQTEIPGTPAELVAAGNRLLVTTIEGRLLCFGGQPAGGREVIETPDLPEAIETGRVDEAADILRQSGVNDGWALALGVGSGELILQLLEQSDLNLMVLEPDRDTADRFRDRTVAAGYGATRVTTLVGRLPDLGVAPYLASLIISETPPSASHGDAFWSALFQSLRPFGGVARLPLAADTDTDALRQTVAAATQPQGQVSIRDRFLEIRRPGPLPGSADWNDPGNTYAGEDALVKAPLGVLWFGDRLGPNYRKSRNPPVVTEGRLFLVTDISGRDLREAADDDIHPRALRAQDVYTGRLLWQIPFDALPDGRKIRGSVDLLAAGNDVYLVHGQNIFHLKARDGSLKSIFRAPATGEQAAPPWSRPLLVNNLLIGIVDPDAADGRRLTALDRHSGDPVWQTEIPANHRLAAGNHRIYGLDPSLTTRAFALDDGRLLWERSLNEEDVPLPPRRGTHLAYSARNDILVQSDRRQNLYGRRGHDGKLLWHREAWHTLPLLLIDDKIIWTVFHSGTSLPALDQFSGNVAMRRHPLTDKPIPWSFSRNYGCNRTLYASRHLFTFRSGTAAFFDLKRDGGTANLTGFRSGCRNNLLPANGVLSAVEMSGGCYCSYPLQSSLALIHRPDAEFWTMNPSRQEVPDLAERNERMGDQSVHGVIRRVGLNFGAPGSRRDDQGMLWLPVSAAPLSAAPALAFTLKTTETADWWRHHSSRLSGTGWPWVNASGIEAIESLSLNLAPGVEAPESRRYTIRLYFAEPAAAPGERRFNVRIQDDIALENIDVAAESGGLHRGLTHEVTGVSVKDYLTLEWIPCDTSRRPPILSGIDIALQAE